MRLKSAWEAWQWVFSLSPSSLSPADEKEEGEGGLVVRVTWGLAAHEIHCSFDREIEVALTGPSLAHHLLVKVVRMMQGYFPWVHGSHCQRSTNNRLCGAAIASPGATYLGAQVSRCMRSMIGSDPGPQL
jgi:hypothetical protein